ncbi:hypothetical protein [Flavobacterium sp.]|uniref:hypothetical protein n=1 Tax=Flavobacterium sp. TaxID=239 RepID=UPI00286D97E9|nr:hypothetical protein [Flavobacterium sp.]
MKNLIGKKVMIDQFLTSDPFNKRGEKGIVIDIKIIDEDSADVTIEFEDGVIGVYEYGTFEIL